MAGADVVVGLDAICAKSINGKGYNSDYGLLGSNMMSDEKLKLFRYDMNHLLEPSFNIDKLIKSTFITTEVSFIIRFAPVGEIVMLLVEDVADESVIVNVLLPTSVISGRERYAPVEEV